MSMLVFLIKSSACLAIFLMFYKLFLENESMHAFKRFYLLAALLLALVIPSITFIEYIEVTSAPASLSPTQNSLATPVTTIQKETPLSNATKTEVNYWPLALWTIYGLGLLLFSLKFISNLWKIARTIRNNPKFKIDSIINVLLRDVVVPHTFLNYIFLNRRKFEAHEIPKDVLIHEATHARQKHSWDILFVELLQILFWFNPLFHLAKNSIKLNHEFLADQGVLDQGVSAPQYQNILLTFASSANYKDNQPSMANAINYSSYSSIKKRFKVMKKNTSKTSVLLRSLLMLPLFAFLLYGFSTTKQISKPLTVTTSLQQGATSQQISIYNDLAKKYNATPKKKRVIPAGHLENLETIYSKMTQEQKAESLPFPECPDIKPSNQESPVPEPSEQEGATKEQIDEYNTLAETYNTMLASKGNIRIKKSDVDRLTYLYDTMTENQRSQAEPFPDFPEPPAPPAPPKPPKSPDVSDKDYAEEVVQEIIAHQDPYDVVGNQIRISPPTNPEPNPNPLKAKSPIDAANHNRNDKPNTGWVVTTNANRNSRQVDEALLPPVTPTISVHIDRAGYSKQLNQAIKKYLQKNSSLEKAVNAYTEHQNGTSENLWKLYNEAIGQYVDYYNLAQEEGNFMQPMLRNTGGLIAAPQTPPKPKSPLVLLKEFKKDNVKIILDGKEINYEEAEKLFEENTFSRVNIRKEKGGRPVLEVWAK